MALELTTNRDDFYGNGVTKGWPTSFKFWEADEIQCTQVSLTGIETPLVAGVDFTVSGGDGQTGTVTTTVAVPGDGTQQNSEQLIVLRVLDLDQTERLKNQGPYYSERVEVAFDQTVAKLQQIAEAVNRSPQYSLSSPAPNLPAPVANKYIGYDEFAQLANLEALGVPEAPQGASTYGRGAGTWKEVWTRIEADAVYIRPVQEEGVGVPVRNLLFMTQAEYDGLSAKSNTTLYLIEEAG